MIKITPLLLFCFSVTFNINGLAQTRYVSTTGVDASNDCSNINNPCKTIGNAVTSAFAGDSIVVASGNYILNGTLDLNKTNVCLTAQNPSNQPAISSNASDVIKISAKDITISNLTFYMGLTASTGLRGIVGENNVDGVRIINNEFYSTNTGDFFSPGMIFGAYAILLYTSSTQDVTATIMNNKISVLDSTNDVFGRGIGVGFNSPSGNTLGVGGIVANNHIDAFYPVQCISVSTDLTFSENKLNGLTMIGYTTDAATVKLDKNTFDAVESKYASQLFTMIDIRANQFGNVVISHNLFKNYEHFAVFSMASKNVSVVSNTFTPLPTANEFISIMANTKLQTSGTQNNTYPNEISIQGNTFNPGVANTGTAIWIADHYGAVTPAFDTIVIGGNVEELKNTFNTDLKHFIRLDSMSGSSDQVEIWNPSGTGDDTPATTMKPVTQDVYALAVNNHYIFNTVNEIETKNIDSLDNQILGKVILGYVSPAGIEEYQSQATMTLYPNPASDLININIKNTDKALIKIVDVLGNVVASKSIQNESSIDVSNLMSGIYFVKMTTGSQNISMRFVKK